MYTETSNLLSWPVEVLQQLDLAIDKRMAEIRIDAINREQILSDAYQANDYSLGFVQTVEAGLQRDKTDLENLISAKCAVVGVLRVKVKEAEALMN